MLLDINPKYPNYPPFVCLFIHLSVFSIISQECSFGDPLPKLLKPVLLNKVATRAKNKRKKLRHHGLLLLSSTPPPPPPHSIPQAYNVQANMLLLAHLSTKCLWWAIVVSQCPSSVVRRAASTIALKTYSSYTPGPIDLILGRKHRVTCRSKIAKIVPIGNPRWPPWLPS